MTVPQQPLTFNDVFEEEDIDEPKGAQTAQHIRANSSIMRFKKILGESHAILTPLLPQLALPGLRLRLY